MTTFKRQAIRYVFLPGIIPRLFRIFSSGFYQTAYLMAVIYQSLRLLPPGHAYLNPQNIGRYGIRHVIAEAANNLVFSRKNIDQIVVFFTILAGMALIVAQIALLIIAMVSTQAAFALPALTPFNLLDVNSPYSHGGAGPAEDLAFMILDRIFGLTANVFGSCIATAAPDCRNLEGVLIPDSTAVYPYPFHLALHSLLRFYSLGIFLVSVFIILYFVTVAVSETALTGTAFGQRFNKTWAPIRLIVFFALLTPLNIGGNNAGLNGAQMIAFWSVKTGSNFASNAWGRFERVLTDAYGGTPFYTSTTTTNVQMVATPMIPEVGPLVQFMFLAKTCRIAEEYANSREHKAFSNDGIQAYIVRDNPAPAPAPMVAEPTNKLLLGSTPFDTALKFSNYGNIQIRFGTFNPNRETNKKWSGNVFPYCGELTLPITSVDTAAPFSGASAVQARYYQLIADLWADTSIVSRAECVVRKLYQPAFKASCTLMPDAAFIDNRVNFYQNQLKTSLPAWIAQQITNGDWTTTNILRKKGWAGAALWYNRIAEQNGDITSAILSFPLPTKYPWVMEEIGNQRARQNKNLVSSQAFNPVLSNGEKIIFTRVSDHEILSPMYYAYKIWSEDAPYLSPFERPSSNMFTDALNLLLGTSGVFDLRQNVDKHPLAQLTTMGKGLMMASIRNLFIGKGIQFVGGKMFDQYTNAMLQPFGSILVVIGTITLPMSFVLCYVLPSLPFIYFLFAIASWIGGIFEAIVAMPLWALAHITRMDGPGLPGPAASNGYYMLLEIAIRPTLILFGMVASITIFSALVKVLHSIFDLITANTGGFNHAGEITGSVPSLIEYMRGPVDEFFFTALYVIIVYMMGLSAFKLIDIIPNNILRFIGTTVATFEAQTGDPAGELSSKTYRGGTILTGQLKGGGLAAFIASTS